MSACLVCSKPLSKPQYQRCREHMVCRRFTGGKHTPEARSRIAAAATGRKIAREFKTPLSKACEQCGETFSGRPGYVAKRQFCSAPCRSLASKKEWPTSCLDCGVRCPNRYATRCATCSHKHFSGPRSSNWRGGVTPARKLERKSPRLIAWRKAVFERDGYTCQKCGKYGGELNADHIKPYILYEELRYELSNGRTLCVPCHRKTDTFGSRVWKQSPVLPLKV